jgi:hypothetical protein
MPSCANPRGQRYVPDWRNMDRHARKAFHVENDSRVRRGLKPREKPEDPKYYHI